MDAIILARHPKYNQLPLDKRILAYYNQEKLNKKRKNLFLEVYGMNHGKSKGQAQFTSFMEIVASFLTFGGIGALGYSVVNKRHQDIGHNIHQLDTVLYDGNIDKFRKRPLKTVGTVVAKTIKKKVVNPIIHAAKKLKSKATQALKTVKTFVTKTAPKAVKKAVQKRVTTAKKAIILVKRVTPKPVKKVVKKIIKRAAPVIKKAIKIIKKAVSPKTKSRKKRRR